MKQTFGMPALLVALSLIIPASGGKQVTEPFIYQEDFESGELKNWASYPPAQDVAWNPNLVPTATPALGRFALRRSFQPARAGTATFGVIKKITILASSSSRLKFSYFVHSYFPPEALRVVLCGSDGERYTYRIAAPALDRWQKTTLEFADFRAAGNSPRPGLEIQAIYWQLDLSHAVPEDRYFLYLDSLEISGERPAPMEITSPTTFSAPEHQTALSTKHFVAGDTFSLALRHPKGSLGIVGVNCLIFDATGKPAGRFVLAEGETQEASGGSGMTWSNRSLFRIDAHTPRGIWKTEITASTADGGILASSFEFLVTDPWPAGVHPRLYFRESDRPRLIAQATLPAMARLWAAIQNDARRSRTEAKIEAGRDIPKLASNPSFESVWPYLRALREAADLIRTNAFVFWLTGDSEARKAAKRGLLEVCGWETWTLPWFKLHGRHTYYPVGMFAEALAFGYDLMYSELSREERELVRRAILDKAVVPGFREYYLNGQIPFPTSNWIAFTTGGPLIGLLAVSEGPDEAEPYFSALLKVLREHWEATYLPDGSYGEGIDYLRFDLETSSRLLAALKNVLNLDLANRYHLARSYLYPLYAFVPPDRYLDFGDTADRLGAETPWAWLASYGRDAHLGWYYQRWLSQRDVKVELHRPWSDLFDFIWYDPKLAVKPPNDLPASRYFPDKGGVVFRSGWDEDAIVLNFTAGPFFNHNHLDQGSFWLSAHGETLLAEAGNTEFYTDEFYQPYFIQSAGHNVILVDGDPASQQIADHRSGVSALNRYPRIVTALTTRVHDQVRAELGSVYEPTLRRFSRSLVFVKPDYIVLFDRLESDGKHQYSELFHPEFAQDLAVDGNQAWIRKEKASLCLRFMTGDVQLSKKPAPIPIRDIAKLKTDPLKERAYLEAKTTQSTNQAAFLVLLYPQRKEDTELPAVERIEGENLLGLRFKSGDSLDQVGFAVQDGLPIRYGDIATDGRSFRTSQGKDRVVSFEAATYFEVEGQKLLHSEKRVSGVVSVSGAQAEWWIVSPSRSAIELQCESKPMQVQLDGKQLATPDYSFRGDVHLVRLVVPEGTHTIAFAL